MKLYIIRSYVARVLVLNQSIKLLTQLNNQCKRSPE